MTPAPPRRPRRWWTVLVQSAICVGLTAMVAWPERHLVLVGFSGREPVPTREPEAVRSSRFVFTRSAGMDLADRPVTRVYAYVGMRAVSGMRIITDAEPWDFRYRDAGLHVLLGDLFE